MIFRGNVNNMCFEILSANEKVVTYRVLLDGSKISKKIHTFGRKAFEHCNLTRMRKKELENLLNEICGKYEDDCSKCPYRKECEEYAHIPEK